MRAPSPRFGRPPIPRAHSAVYGVENPGYVISHSAGPSAVYGVEDPGFAATPHSAG